MKNYRLANVAAALAAVSLALAGIAATAGAAGKSATLATARQALLVRSDFPSGWTTSSGGGNSPSNIGIAQMSGCLGVPAKVVKYNPPTANSPEFDQNNSGFTVDDNVAVFPSVKVATQQFNIFGSSLSATCIARAFNTPTVKAVFAKSIGNGAKIGLVTAKNAPKLSVPNKSTALQMQFPISTKSTKITLSMTLVIIMSKSMTEGSELAFISYLSPFPSALEARLEAITASRLG
jgi:hypothetical protein